jgi:fermentation-respiration switch protein FrsA (DUF1100 family)
MKLSWRTLRNLVFALVLIYALGLVGLVLFQRNFLFPYRGGYISLEAAHAPEALKEITVTTDDNLKIIGWYAPAAGKNRTLVFFHGNGDGLASVAFVAKPFIEKGYGFLLVEYRGYSGQPGFPTEKNLYSDARVFIRHLLANGVKESDLVFYGHSLGTGVALQMATEFKASGLVLEAPYMSIARMGQLRFPMFPAEMLTLDRFESFKKIPSLHMPLLVAHGEWDLVVPYDQGKALFDLAPEPKTFIAIPNGGHSDLSTHFGLADKILNWLAAL